MAADIPSLPYGTGTVTSVAALLGITVAWISGRPSGATTARAAELKVVHVLQGRND